MNKYNLCYIILQIKRFNQSHAEEKCPHEKVESITKEN